MSIQVPIPQAQLDTFAQGVADDLHKRSGKTCGWFAKAEAAAGGPVITFTFKLGEAPMTHCRAPIADLQRAAAQGWGGLHDGMVEHVLKSVPPVPRVNGEHPPELEPLIDAQGRRHHRLIAEPGIFHRIKGS